MQADDRGYRANCRSR